MPANNFYYGCEKETTEGTVVKSDPFRLGEHQHKFCFAISEAKVLRGCEICGRAWIVRHDGVQPMPWKEIGEKW